MWASRVERIMRLLYKWGHVAQASVIMVVPVRSTCDVTKPHPPALVMQSGLATRCLMFHPIRVHTPRGGALVPL